VYDLEDFVKEHELIGKVDLIIMGECFHWFDAPRALEVLHSVAKESDAIVALWGYSLFNAISTDVFKDSV
jgi:glycogen debranching enzyme